MSGRIFRAALFLLGLSFAGLAMAQPAAPTTGPTGRGPRGGAAPANPNLPTLWIVGDSTANNHANGGLGWGDPFIKMFDPAKVNVMNKAIGGRSSRSFIVEGHWDDVLAMAKTGDYLILQMGHNDGGDVANANGRPSLRGTGEETQEITKANGQKETVHTYGWYMRKYITDAKAKGMTVIVASSVPHMPREAVKAGDVETRFVQVAWAEEVAKSQNVLFIPVNQIVLSHYVGIEPADIKTKFFTPPADGTHTNPDGAALNAKSVVEGLKTLDLPLKNFLLASDAK